MSSACRNGKTRTDFVREMVRICDRKRRIKNNDMYMSRKHQVENFLLIWYSNDSKWNLTWSFDNETDARS